MGDWRVILTLMVAFALAIAALMFVPGLLGAGR